MSKTLSTQLINLRAKYGKDWTDDECQALIDCVALLSRMERESERAFYPEPGVLMWWVNSGGIVYSQYWEGTEKDVSRLERGWCFETEDEALQCARRMQKGAA